MRRNLASLVTAAASLMLTLGDARAQPKEPGLTVFIGTYTRGWACPPGAKNTAACTSKGIYRAVFDPGSGALSQLAVAAESDNPSYLAVSADGKFLYAVNEVGDFNGEKEGAVSAFAIEPTGKLRLINQLSSHGADPCHVSITASGKHLLLANYSGGNIASYQIGAGGELKEGSTVPNEGTHGPHLNQDAAHAHFIVEGPTPGLIYVADLGLDKVMLYDLDPANGKLKPHAAAPFAAVPPGGGPRHLVVHPNKKFLYTNNELATAASVFARDPATGNLTQPPVQTISTIPLPYAKSSDNGEILISGDGRFLYVSNRGHDSIGVFGVDEATGKLTPVQNVRSGGRIPRDFKFDPSGKFLLVGHQGSDDVIVFRVDAKTGKVKPSGRKLKVSKPVNFAFWKGAQP